MGACMIMCEWRTFEYSHKKWIFFRKETGATDDDITNIMGRKLPETDSAKCFAGCAGEQLQSVTWIEFETKCNRKLI